MDHETDPPVQVQGYPESMHRALLSEPLARRHVRCGVCQRRCDVAPGKTGYCKTRKNVDGVLYSLIYGCVSSVRVSPIEIKPLFHFYPGSRWLSLGSLGCNFLCPGCQNWEIAHADAEKDMDLVSRLSPEDSVELARQKGCKGISWTYNEPTLWLEYTLDSAKLARDAGLLTNYVTNGYITFEALDLLGPYLDAYRVDLKGFSNETYRRIANVPNLKGILDIIERAKCRWNMHVEIITNLISSINDREDELKNLASWIVEHLGPDTPWHVTRFFPYLRLSHLPPTPVASLERAREIGLEQGLEYVYLGNMPGHPAENTYCPGCGRMIIERRDYTIIQYHLRSNRCAFCNRVISGRFEETVR
jgi:pyruvate formate lyase activating enzyme